MKKTLFILIVFLCSFAFSAVKLTADQLLKQVQRKYAKFQDFQADFNQVINYRGLNREGKSSGKIYYMRPNKIRWMQEKPDRAHYISNGKLMWLFLPDELQAYENKNVAELVEKIKLIFLSSNRKLTERFKVSLLIHDKNKKIFKKPLKTLLDGSNAVYEFVPRKQESFQKAWITASRKTRNIQSVMIYDLARNKILINIKNIKFNQKLNKAFFDFNPPEQVNKETF